MKELLKNIKKWLTISIWFIIWILILWWLYVFAASLTATDWETLTASKWNSLVAKFTNCTVSTYSTSEVLTWERWIDWKPIYKIVVDFWSIPWVSSYKDVSIPWYNSLNYYWIENASTFRTSDNQTISIPYNNWVAMLNIALLNWKIRIISWTNDLSTFNITKIILKYTKTTDTSSSPVANICE